MHILLLPKLSCVIFVKNDLVNMYAYSRRIDSASRLFMEAKGICIFPLYVDYGAKGIYLIVNVERLSNHILTTRA
jgi:hypothetical protein